MNTNNDEYRKRLAAALSCNECPACVTSFCGGSICTENDSLITTYEMISGKPSWCPAKSENVIKRRNKE